MKKLVLGVSFSLFIGASLFNFTGNNPGINEALAGGTCCEKSKSTCYPGSCSDSSCAQKSAFWRSDGKSCGAIGITQPISAN